MLESIFLVEGPKWLQVQGRNGSTEISAKPSIKIQKNIRKQKQIAHMFTQDISKYHLRYSKTRLFSHFFPPRLIGRPILHSHSGSDLSRLLGRSDLGTKWSVAFPIWFPYWLKNCTLFFCQHFLQIWNSIFTTFQGWSGPVLPWVEGTPATADVLLFNPAEYYGLPRLAIHF